MQITLVPDSMALARPLAWMGAILQYGGRAQFLNFVILQHGGWF